MDYINTSHPNFIGGSKAVEIALQQIKSSKVPLPITRHKVNMFCFNTYVNFYHCIVCKVLFAPIIYISSFATVVSFG